MYLVAPTLYYVEHSPEDEGRGLREPVEKTPEGQSGSGPDELLRRTLDLRKGLCGREKKCTIVTR